MKNIVFILLFILLLGTCLAQAKRIEPINSDNIINVGLNFKYKTISSAINAWIDGKIIIIAPEVFDEIVYINKPNIIIQGTYANASKIKSIIIMSAGCQINNITITNKLEVNCSTNYYSRNWADEGIYLNNCIIIGDIYIGTEDIKNVHPVTIENTRFIGENKLMFVNSQHILMVKYCFIFRYNVNIKGGQLLLENCSRVFLINVHFDNSLYFVLIGVSNCPIFYIEGIITSANSTSNYAVFFIQHSKFWQYYNGQMNKFTVNGKFEFDLFNVYWYMADLEYNSTVPSRFINVTQCKWMSDKIITGNSNLKNLHIFNSIFRCSSPDSLGTNSFNAWNAFIDD